MHGVNVNLTPRYLIPRIPGFLVKSAAKGAAKGFKNGAKKIKKGCKCSCICPQKNKQLASEIY
jgi:hypothetical protein